MTPAPACPSCAEPLTGAATCAACGLPLHGPLAGRLWQVDQRLIALDAEQLRLRTEREELLVRLRSGETEPVPATGAPPPLAPALTRPARPAPKETSPQQVQNTLLTLGALLLGVAGAVFAAANYDELGVVGRALILLTLTGVAAWVPSLLFKRNLTASAEAISGVAVALACLDAWALRQAGFGRDLESSTYLAVASAVLAGGLAAYARVVPTRVPRYAAAFVAQLPVPALLASLDASPESFAVALTAQAGLNGLAAVASPLPLGVRRLVGGLAGFLTVLALMLSLGSVAADREQAWMGFVALACLTALASWQGKTSAVWHGAAAAVVPLAALAAWAAARDGLTRPQEPLVAVAVAIIGLQVVAMLPRERREGAAYGALAVSMVTVLADVEAVLEALIGPFGWLALPWTRTASTARFALSPDLTWSGTVVTLVVLLGAAVACIVAGLALERVQQSLVPAAVLVVLSAITMPLGLATSYRDALVLLLVVAAALGGGGLALLGRVRLPALALVCTGTAVALLAGVWSLADETATLIAFPVLAVLSLGVALVLPGPHTALTLLLGGVSVAAFGSSQGLAAEQVGGLLLVPAAVCVALTFALPRLHRLGAEAAAVILAVAAPACATEDAGWFSWTLAGAGLLALATSVHPDRRLVGIFGGLLLSASSWVRLADADVTAPEPYVLPLAAAALVAGWFRRRAHPSAGSWECYATGLGLALLPSLFQSFADSSPTRGLLVLSAAVVVTLVAAQTKLQAPLAIGAVVGAVEGIYLMAPYANALPRWLLLGALGLLLVGVAATYEARLRDLRRMRESFDALT